MFSVYEVRKLNFCVLLLAENVRNICVISETVWYSLMVPRPAATNIVGIYCELRQASFHCLVSGHWDYCAEHAWDHRQVGRTAASASLLDIHWYHLIVQLSMISDHTKHSYSSGTPGRDFLLFEFFLAIPFILISGQPNHHLYTEKPIYIGNFTL